jgi:hypothetical protein
MKIFEFDAQVGRYDPNADQISMANITDTRKDRLTLRDLNKLKKLRALRRLEALKQQDIIAVIYGATDDGGGPDDMM